MLARSLLARLAPALACLPAACGAGSAALVGSGGGGDTNSPATVSAVTLDARTSPGRVAFVLSDPEGDPADVGLYFLRAGDAASAAQPLQLAPGTSLTGLAASSEGKAYEIEWDYEAQLGTPGYTPGVTVFATVAGGLQSIAPELTNAATAGVGNDPPQLGELELPGGVEVAGNVDVFFELADSAGDPVDLRLEYDLVGDVPDAGWRTARPAGLPASQATPEWSRSAVATQPGGELQFAVWDSAHDLGGLEVDVRLRVVARDDWSSPVASPVLADVRVDANEPPLALLLDGELVANPDRRGGIPVPFVLVDEESDPTQVVLQWAPEGEPFPELPQGAAGLGAVLASPALRRELQVCEELSRVFDGVLGPLPPGADPLRDLRLTELATTRSSALVYGLAGRTLHVLRAARHLAPVEWSGAAPRRPVAALPLDGGERALVLDDLGASWRLLLVHLAAGAVEEELASSSGRPTALARMADGLLAIASVEAGHWKLDRYEASSGLLDPLPGQPVDATGLRALCPLAPRRVIASAGDGLFSIDLATGDSLPMTAGLAQPWGLARHPLHPSTLFVAERGADRVIAFDLDTCTFLLRNAAIPPGREAELGPVPLPRPSGLALEFDGARLVVATEPAGGGVSLRTLELREPQDLDGDGRADPIVASAGELEGSGPASLATDEEGTRVAAAPQPGALAVGGGVQLAVPLVAEGTPGEPPAYRPRGQLARSAAPLPAVPAPGGTWELRATVGSARTSPEGVRHALVWDTTGLERRGPLRLRASPFDTDPGVAGTSTVAKDLAPPVLEAPVVLPGTTYIAHERTMEALFADFDGDGDEDVLARNYSEPGLSVYPNLGRSGLSGPLVLYRFFMASVGRVTLGDLSGDGLLDVLYSYSGVDAFEPGPDGIVECDPDLCYSIPSSSVGGSLANAIACDLDGDGVAEVVACNATLSEVDVLERVGPTEFALRARLDGDGVPMNGTSLVAAGDLDRDGLPDLVCGNSVSNNFAVFLADPAGGFLPASELRLPGVTRRPTDLHLADLDRDGSLDVLTANLESSAVVVFWGQGDGSFDPTPSGIALPFSSSSASRYQVCPTDVDGDGDLDLGFGGLQNNVHGLSVAIHGPSRSFASSSEVATPAEFDRAVGVAAGDLEGDGAPELAFCTEHGKKVVLQSWRPRRWEGASALSSDIDGTYTVDRLADLSGSGLLDVVGGTPTGLARFPQTSPGRFGGLQELLHTVVAVRAVHPADWDADGDLDLAFFTALDELRVLYRVGSAWQERGAPLDAPDSGGLFRVADLDGDGALDLLGRGAGGAGLVLYRASAAGGFEEPVDIAADRFAYLDFAAEQLDGQGSLEVVTLDVEGRLTVQRWLGEGRLELVSQRSVAAGIGSARLTTGDLDADGRSEVIVGFSVDLDRTFAVFGLEEGDGLVERQRVDAPWVFSAIGLWDEDGDGDLDLVFNDSMLRSLGGGRLEDTPRPLFEQPGTGFYTRGYADVDGDGRRDLLGIQAGAEVNWGLRFGGH